MYLIVTDEQHLSVNSSVIYFTTIVDKKLSGSPLVITEGYIPSINPSVMRIVVTDGENPSINPSVKRAAKFPSIIPSLCVKKTIFYSFTNEFLYFFFTLISKAFSSSLQPFFFLVQPSFYTVTTVVGEHHPVVGEHHSCCCWRVSPLPHHRCYGRTPPLPWENHTE